MQRFVLPLLFLLALPLALPLAATSTDPPAEAFSPEALRADFDQLYRTLQASHFDLFVSTSRDELDAAHARLRSELDRPMTRAEAALTFQRFVALGRVAHCKVASAPEAFLAFLGSGGEVLPLEVRVDDGRVFVARLLAPTEGLHPGDEIVTLEGEPIARWIPRLTATLSADTDYLAETLLGRAFPQAIWEVLGARESFELGILDSSGASRTSRVAAVDLATIRSAPPDSLLDLSSDDREARMLSEGIAYLRPGPFYEPGDDPWDTTEYLRFLDASFEKFLEAEALALLVDLRSNPGGDASFSDPLMAWVANEPFRFASSFRVKVSRAAIEANAARLETGGSEMSRFYAREYPRHSVGSILEVELPEVQPRPGKRFRGDVYVLVDRHSYSNAVTLAALLQDSGRATILGEETADLASTLGAVETFELDRTGIAVEFPKAQIVRPSGDPTRRGVVPDVPIETPVVQTRDDPVLQEALEIVRRGGS